jgi:two-component sensor histidine kinase
MNGYHHQVWLRRFDRLAGIARAQHLSYMFGEENGVLRSLSKIDLPGRLSPVLPIWAGEAVTALICLAVTGVTRVVMDAVAPGIAPFVLIFPACLIATLVGGWRPGLGTLAAAGLAAWAYVIPPRGLIWKGEAQPANLIAIVLTSLVVIAAAQIFRATAMRDADDGRAKLAERDLMLRELEHRTKNNFQTVAALLGMQLRRASNEPARMALGDALRRVTSISQAQRNLYVAADDPQAVDMAVYLRDLCANLAEALFLGELVRLECKVEAGALERDRAVAVGLIVNELVTNAAKHAFDEGAIGLIRVAFSREATGYRLTVEDDGRGLPDDYATRRQGLGRGLVEAFTRQAGGALTIGEGPGARFKVELRPERPPAVVTGGRATAQAGI